MPAFAEFDEFMGARVHSPTHSAADKQQLARFVEQTAELHADAPSITGKIEALKTSVGEVEAIALKPRA